VLKSLIGLVVMEYVMSLSAMNNNSSAKQPIKLSYRFCVNSGELVEMNGKAYPFC